MLQQRLKDYQERQRSHTGVGCPIETEDQPLQLANKQGLDKSPVQNLQQ